MFSVLGIAVNEVIKSFAALKNENIELTYGKVLYKKPDPIIYLKEGISAVDKAVAVRDTLENSDDRKLHDEVTIRY